MIKKIRIRLIIEVFCALLIVGIAIAMTGGFVVVKGWSNFKSSIKNKFPFVHHVEYEAYGALPLLEVQFRLNRYTTNAEADAVYEFTKNYLDSNEVLDDFSRYYFQRRGTGSSYIKVYLYYEGDSVNQYYEYDLDIGVFTNLIEGERRVKEEPHQKNAGWPIPLLLFLSVTILYCALNGYFAIWGKTSISRASSCKRLLGFGLAIACLASVLSLWTLFGLDLLSSKDDLLLLILFIACVYYSIRGYQAISRKWIAHQEKTSL